MPIVKLTAQRPSIGRVLHVYSAHWSGAQPGIVSNGPWDEPFLSELGPAVNVNVIVDAANNPKVLELWRARSSGNTLCSVPVFDALSEEQRAIVRQQLAGRGDDLGAWAEWPPRV